MKTELILEKWTGTLTANCSAAAGRIGLEAKFPGKLAALKFIECAAG